MGDAIYFVGDDGITGQELWKYDGNELTQVADLNPGPARSYPNHFSIYDDHLYFGAEVDGSSTGFWKTDGTTMEPVADVRIFGADDATIYHGELYFRGMSETGIDLWKTDGATVTEVADLNPRTNSDPTGMTVYKDELYFVAEDEEYGGELYKTDGSDVVRLTDIAPGYRDGLKTYEAPILAVFDDQLYFVADDGTTGDKLWRTDGDDIRLVDFETDYTPRMYHSRTPIEFRGDLYFLGTDPVGGTELWKVTPVPEPGTIPLTLAMLLTLLIAYAYRKHRRRLA